MIKTDLIDKFAKEMDISKQESERSVKTFFQILKEAIETGEEIEIRKFGSFRFRERKSHPGLNFKTGEVIQVPSRTDIVFKPSRLLRIKKENE